MMYFIDWVVIPIATMLLILAVAEYSEGLACFVLVCAMVMAGLLRRKE